VRDVGERVRIDELLGVLIALHVARPEPDRPVAVGQRASHGEEQRGAERHDQSGDGDVCPHRGHRLAGAEPRPQGPPDSREAGRRQQNQERRDESIQTHGGAGPDSMGDVGSRAHSSSEPS
jgi:hypothetical protein